MIDGAKFDLISNHSPNFQTTHSFGWGSAQSPSVYNFGAMFATNQVCSYRFIPGNRSLHSDHPILDWMGHGGDF